MLQGAFVPSSVALTVPRLVTNSICTSLRDGVFGSGGKPTSFSPVSVAGALENLQYPLVVFAGAADALALDGAVDDADGVDLLAAFGDFLSSLLVATRKPTTMPITTTVPTIEAISVMRRRRTSRSRRRCS